MPSKIMCAIAAFFFAAQAVVAQTADPSSGPLARLLPALDSSAWAAPRQQTVVWGSAEYLMWTINSTSLPPLVTTGNPGIAAPAGQGALGAPGTQILFGNGPVNFGLFSGTRLNLGGWLDANQTWGAELSGFLLAQRSVNYNNASDGSPALYVPAYNTNPFQGPAHQGSFPIADSVAGLSGNIAISTTSQLWGVELNGIFRSITSTRWKLDLLFGFRYLGLQENFFLDDNIYGASAAHAPFQVRFQDFFGTQNQFFGEQVGTRFIYQMGRLSAEVTGKVAIGVTQGVVNINGQDTVTGTGAGGVGLTTGTFAGGLFAQPTNIGREVHDAFSVVPALQFKLGWDVTSYLRATVGYDLLCWTSVVRPGEQIDRSVNTSQSQFAPPGTSVLTGPSNPTPFFNHSTFFAQGMSLGLEFRY